MVKNKKRVTPPGNKVYIIDDAKSPFVVTEAFRKIATNIGFAIPKKEDNRAKVFCITSAVAGEGKTTISVNLALSMVRSGLRVALVDCDLRNPSIKRSLVHSQLRKGVESYLSGQASLEEIIYRDKSGLDVVAALLPAPNPMSLLHSEAFDHLIGQLSYLYEMVIVDTPPLGIVSDASIIGPRTDGVVIVTRQLYSDHKLLKSVVGQLEFAKCNILGFILNGFALPKEGFGKYGKYGKYGKSGYGEAKRQ